MEKISSCNSLWPSCLTLGEAFVSVACMLSIMVLIILGNLMVVLTSLDPRFRKQRQNWLIISLAIADLLVGLLVMPLTMIYEIIGGWILGNILCDLWLALDVLLVSASILHICIISLDRYWSVTSIQYPNKRTPLRICLMIGFAWIVSLLICLPPFFGWKTLRNPGECSVSQDLGYVLYSSLGSFYIPVGILVIVYWRIYTITKQHSRQRLKDTQRTDETLYQLTSEINPLPIDQPTTLSKITSKNNKSAPVVNNDTLAEKQIGIFTNIFSRWFSIQKNCYIEQAELANNNSCDGGGGGGANISNGEKKKSLQKRRKLLKVKERQATLLLGLILTAFIASWLPFFLLYLLGAFGYQAPTLAFKFFFWLGYCNSAINPVIYTVFNRDFKRALFRLLRKYQHYFIFIKPHIY